MIHGKPVGTDSFGNQYYRGKARKGLQKERRWVMYKGKPEASAVPPEWHGWLHYQTDTIPADENSHRKHWQKPHQPNKTGTAERYLPSSLKGQPRAARRRGFHADREGIVGGGGYGVRGG